MNSNIFIPMSPSIFFVTGLALSCAMLSGLFFVFSNFAMKAFSKLPADSSIMAMQSINKSIINSGFMGLFIGTATGSLTALIVALKHSQHPASVWAASGALLCLTGCFLVTAGINVPLNNKLESINPASEQAGNEWQSYHSRWQPWNHIRTISTLLAGVCFAICALKMAGA